MKTSLYPISLLALVIMSLAWSGLGAEDRFTWALETIPVWLGVAILLVTRTRFRPSCLLYTVLAIHAVILCVGGRYTYAEVPLGFWFQNALELSRNHYDRLGHFAQGFGPAVLAREILIRQNAVKPSWLFFIVCCVCLSFSAFYELIEWWTAVGTGEAATAFLGTQGDVWDTQWDMCWALIGSIVAQLTLRRSHDRQLKAMGYPTGSNN